MCHTTLTVTKMWILQARDCVSRLRLYDGVGG